MGIKIMVQSKTRAYDIWEGLKQPNCVTFCGRGRVEIHIQTRAPDATFSILML